MRRAFNREKYKELLIYVVESTSSLPNFGSILLNKVLVNCDFTAYRVIGAPMTAQPVQHEQMGPISKPLIPVAREMEDFDGSLEMQRSVYFGHQQRRFVAKRKANMREFSNDEIEIIDAKIEFWSKMNGTEASLASHQIFGGWAFTDNGEEIRYETALLSMYPLTQEAKDYALELVK